MDRFLLEPQFLGLNLHRLLLLFLPLEFRLLEAMVTSSLRQEGVEEVRQ